MIKRYIYILGVLLVGAFASCSKDDVLDENGYGPSVTVKASIGTRATGVPEATSIDEELINDWWVLFVDGTGKIAKYIDRQSTTGLHTSVESEEFELDLPTGDYTAYSFANISKATVEGLAGVGAGALDPGNPMPDLSNVQINIDDILPIGTTVTGNDIDIPMTGKQDIRFASSGIQFIELEVIRAVAKMEFLYSNESRKDITINSIKISQAPSNFIPLLPNYTYIESGWPVGAVTPSDDLLGTVNGEYSEVNKEGTGSHPYTKIADRHWTVDLYKFAPADPNWYSRIFWITGKSVTPSDAVEVSMVLNAQYDIADVQVGLTPASSSEIAKIGATMNLAAGVDTPVNFTISGMDFANLRLQINAAYSATNHNLMHIKDVQVNRIVSRPYLRDYQTAYGSKPSLTKYTTSPADSWTDRFYMRESRANYNISQRYLMTVNITRDGGHPEDLLFALTKDMSSIYRNDHIVLPLILSDYMVSLDVNFYPPILGYPAVITRESEEEFLCEFATPGAFEILPKVINSFTGYSLVYNTGDPHFTYTITGISDPDNIFSTSPYIETGTGETHGELSTNEGIAYVDIEVTVHRTSVADQIYERRIYIIRKN